MLANGFGAIAVHDFRVPEIADYELRRELLRMDSKRGLERLDNLGHALGYLPVTTTGWRRAAELWADRRRAGRPTADPASIDADLLLAAQALAEGGTVVTTNTRHFQGIVDALTWNDVPMT